MPFFASDADALKAGTADNARRFPQKKLDVLRVIGEGDLVTDIGMEVPADMKNERGMF